ncbi:NeuD/PglB/VioB family sugar acetyltransferase [Prochlorococcus sp. MIT 1306]|uniref:NeuD/PglB/VioB family sugar acetyltransferase n=1 Tax=Prochlorococcus sp. MIT 1306 TaxID=1799667 RepID=UPI0007B3DF8E|nr:NeuD/PglB/VioB family sugar acetyltransferase [Prochlorococcus sp. MIT 1306]KZR61083.1 putative acetyltransferase EpsM [Prochlorococcus sp. MIT 1306]
MNKLLIAGCGGHAKSVIDIIESQDIWKIQGLVGTKEELHKTLMGYSVVGCDDDLENLSKICHSIIIGIGQIKDPTPRIKVAQLIKTLKFNIPIIVSSNSYVSKHCKIGEGTLVSHGTIVNADSHVGRHCILNSNCLIEHDVSIGDFCHISTGVLINGSVKIGDRSFVGSGAIIREGVVIPPGSIISAGKRVM